MENKMPTKAMATNNSVRVNARRRFRTEKLLPVIISIKT